MNCNKQLAEQAAERIMKAAGTSLRHYMKHTQEDIVSTVESVISEAIDKAVAERERVIKHELVSIQKKVVIVNGQEEECNFIKGSYKDVAEYIKNIVKKGK